jgi:uncharacterized protein YutE (UPF0331/DUF86 family)
VKIDKTVIENRILEIRDAIKNIQRVISKPYDEISLDEDFSVRYNIIVLVEALVSICVYVSKEILGYTPSSYRDAVSHVCKKLGIKCAEDLVALVRLRNILVHRYWVVDGKILYESAKKDFACIEEFLESLSSYLDER